MKLKYKKYTCHIRSIKNFKILKDHNNYFSKTALSFRTLNILLIWLIKYINYKSDPFIGSGKHI